MTELTQKIIEQIFAVPPGKVASYGDIARRAGNPRAARQVVRVLHIYGGKLSLPWHRIVGSDGSIRLAAGAGLEEQAAELQSEGVEISVARNGRAARVEIDRYR